MLVRLVADAVMVMVDIHREYRAGSYDEEGFDDVPDAAGVVVVEKLGYKTARALIAGRGMPGAPGVRGCDREAHSLDGSAGCLVGGRGMSRGRQHKAARRDGG